MFTIGQTSGVASRSAPEGEPIITIKNYLTKMAKCAEDLPKPHVAATKVVEVSQGSFSGGTVLTTSTGCGGGGGGGGCGGSSSAGGNGGSSCSGSGGCGGKSCCGGGGSGGGSGSGSSSGGSSSGSKSSSVTSNMQAGCAGGNLSTSGTSTQRGKVDQNGNTNPSNSSNVTNGGGTTYTPPTVKGGIKYTSPRTNVTPANGTMTIDQPVAGPLTMHVDNEGNITYTTTAPDGSIVNVDGPIGGYIPYSSDAEVGNVVNYAANHARDMVNLENTGIKSVSDPIFEASKWLANPTVSSKDTVTTPSSTATSPSKVAENNRAFSNGKSTKISPSINIPSDINDILNSSYAMQVDNQKALSDNFRSTVCERMPYPECAACKYSHTTIKMTETDLYDLLYGVQSGLDAISKGNCSWGEQQFNCPGMLAKMLEQKFGSTGTIVGANAAGTMIATTAAHGALNAHSNLSTAFLPTDFKISLRKSIGRAISSGGCPQSYSNLISKLLKDLDLPAKDLFVQKAVNTDDITHNSSARNAVLTTTQPASEESQEKMDTVQSYVDRVNDKAQEVLDNPLSATESGSALPTSGQNVKVPTTDFRFQPGVKYYRYVGDDPITGEKLYVQLPSSEVIPGLSTSPAIAKYGKVYIDESDALVSVADPEKGMELLSTGVMGEVEIPIPLDMVPGMAKDGFLPIDFSAGSASIPKCSTTVPTDDLYVKTQDAVGVATKTYYKYVPDHYDELGVLVEGAYVEIPGSTIHGIYIDSHPYIVYEKIPRELQVKTPKKPKGSTEYYNDLGIGVTSHKRLPVYGPVVFDNGLMVEPVVSTDAAAYTECVSTPSLVTETGITVASMADLYKIGLTTDEIKLAYALDHDINGSILPSDCDTECLATILDTIEDDDDE